MPSTRPTSENAEDILSFWFQETQPYQWFRRDSGFDAHCRERFGALHEAAKHGGLDVWRVHPRHSLALIILLDQFSRNIYRDEACAFAQDAQALDVAQEAIARWFDRPYASRERAFFYMPFMHAEDLIMQERSVALFTARMPASGNVPYAEEHRNIVKRFGRFPHRNRTLERPSTPEETAFLKAGGFNP